MESFLQIRKKEEEEEKNELFSYPLCVEPTNSLTCIRDV